MSNSASSNPDAYLGQDRWGSDAYRQYYAGMDATAQWKRAAASVHLPSGEGKTIADMGMGSGKPAFLQALLDPWTRIVGVDINPVAVTHAEGEYRLPNLSFCEGDIEQMVFPPESLSGILNSSSLHHVHSFNGYDPARVRHAIANQVRQLETGGILAIRDFVIPDEGFVRFELPNRADGANPEAELLIRFSQTARALASEADRGFFLEEIELSEGVRSFRIEARHAAEFILRKDYEADWDTELLEEYGYFTQSEFERAFCEEGLRIVISKPFRNPWIVRNRFRGKYRAFRENGEELDFFSTNYVIVGQKVPVGSGVRLREKSPVPVSSDSGYLSFSSHREIATGNVFDLVRRQGEVADLFPFSLKDWKICLLLKAGAPRPMLNVVGRGSPNLDRAAFSGYVTEPISVAAKITDIGQRTSERLAEAIGMEVSENFGFSGPSYFPSPGGIDEFVSSRFVEIPPLSDGRNLSAWGNFTTGGTTKLMDVQEILRVAQTGGLPEARTELAAYVLLQKTGVLPDAWIGDSLPVFQGATNDVATMDEMFVRSSRPRFEPADRSAGFLSQVCSRFVEETTDVGKPSVVAENSIDFVIPKKLSTNTVSVLPILKDASGEVFVGVEKRCLPVCEVRFGSSEIVTVPAFRLEKSIDSFVKAESFIAERFGNRADESAPLGEAYFPSMGITPEKVHPYSVTGPDLRLPEGVRFLSLRELFARSDEIRDMQLLVSVFGTVHALGLWKEYAG